MLRLKAAPAPVGDFEVQRVLPQRERRFVGPICFLDHFGPHTGVGDANSGVGPHPHIGLSTVTYLFDGETLHRDSLGTEQLIRPGEVNWMTAGKGIAHSERTPPPRWGQPMTSHGLQVWVGLPQALEESEPSFQHVARSDLPRWASDEVELDVVLGRWGSLVSPVRVTSPTFYVVASLENGGRLDVPTEFSERAVYVVEGSVCVGDEVFSAHEVAVLDAGRSVEVSAPHRARVAIFGGEPLDGPRYLLWNFVSSRKERLQQARTDWIQRRFPLIPGDADTRIPFPGETP
ncbi:MAG: pirin family protein [Archangium sp.]|nr:pirin family protein [Archangium sp.]